jgi:solute:Na+ symporter, SSS family
VVGCRHLDHRDLILGRIDPGGAGLRLHHGHVVPAVPAGDILAAGIVAVLFIPFFHKVRGLTTAYEYLEARFDVKTRLLGSTLFSLTVLLRAGTLLFGAALLFSAVVPTNLIPGLTGVEEAVVIFGLIAIVYTVLGGISAVIWTDVIQFAIMSIGIIASMAVVVIGTPGGWEVAFAEAGEAGKLNILRLEDGFAGTSLLTAVFGYGLLALSLFGTNQQPVQRYMTVKNPREAQGAATRRGSRGDRRDPLAAAGRLPLHLLRALPGASPSRPERRSDHAALREHAGTADPDGRAGGRRLRRRDVEPGLRAELAIGRADRRLPGSLQDGGNGSEAAGVREGGGGHGRVAGNRDRDLFVPNRCSADRPDPELHGVLRGRTAGLFLLGMLSKRANGNGAFTGAIVGTLVVLMVTANDFPLPRLYEIMGFEPIPFIWSTAIGLMVTLIVGYVVSLFGQPMPPERLENTTVNWTAAQRSEAASRVLNRTAANRLTPSDGGGTGRRRNTLAL